jgi:hypothetical protein
MINDLLEIILLSLIPCCFGYFLDYCLGQPGSDDPKTGEIFSGYTLWISRKTLQPGYLNEITERHADMLDSEDPMTRIQGEDQKKKVIIEEAKKLFTWQKAIGMCVFCTNVWISWISCFVFYFTVPLQNIHPIFFFLLIPIFSHAILRKL